MSYDKGQLLKFGGDRVDKSKVLFFKDGVEDWFEFTQGLDFLVSTRIHGGMAGVTVGVPTLFLPTDFRIMELVNAMPICDDCEPGKITDATEKSVCSFAAAGSLLCPAQPRALSAPKRK